MYADSTTPSMRAPSRRPTAAGRSRSRYNKSNGIDPTPLRKRIADITDMLAREDADTQKLLGGGGRQQSRGKAPVPGARQPRRGRPARERPRVMPAADLADLIQQLNDQMRVAAEQLQFELAARLRDEISELKRELRGMHEAGVR